MAIHQNRMHGIENHLANQLSEDKPRHFGKAANKWSVKNTTKRQNQQQLNQRRSKIIC